MSSSKIPLRLLIVEDSADDTFFLVRTLESEGYEVAFSRVDTSAAMVQALEQETWDAIISDYQMPGFDGLAALKIYKVFDLDIPFIVVSGAIGEETAVKVMKAGAHDYLIKDNLTRLVPAIQRELQEAKIRQERREALLALQHSESRYRAIVEDQTELINRCTLDGTITYVNNAYARLHHKTPQDFIGGKYEDFISKEDAAKLENIRSKLSPENPVTTSESCFEKQAGEVIWIQWLDRLIVDDHGNPIEYQGVGRDITDQKLAEGELKEFAASLERRAIQLQVAAEIARDATSIRELSQLLRRAVNLVRDRFGFYYAGVFLLDENGEYAVLKAATGDPGQALIEKGHKLKIGEAGIVGHVVGTSQPRTSPDVRSDSVHLIQPLLPETRSEMALPLKVGEGIIGALDVQSEKENAFDEQDIQILQTMADQLAIAIDNLRLFSEVQQRAKELESLYSAALVTSSELEIEALLDRLYEQVQRFIAPDSLAVGLYDREKEELSLVLARADGKPIEAFTGLRLPLDEGGLFGYVIRTRQSLNIGDLKNQDLPVEPIGDPLEERPARTWLGVPLIVRDQILGVVSIQSFQPDTFGESHQRFLESLAAQFAIAFENAHLFEAEEKRARELETLRQVGLSLTASLEPEAVLQAILEGVFKLIPEIWHANLYLYQEGKLTFGAARWGNADQKFQLADVQVDGPLYSVAISGEMITIPYFSLNQLFIDLQDDELHGSIVSFPLKIGERVTGVMTVIDFNQQEFSEPELRVLNLLADQAALAIENAHLFQQTTTERRHIALLYDLGRSIAVSLEPVLILQAALDLTCSALGGNVGAAWLYLPDEKRVRLIAFFNQNGVTLTDISESENMDLKFGVGVIGWVAENRTPVNIACIQEDSRWIPVDYIEDVQSMLAAPILEGENLLGVIAVQHHQVDAFNDNHLDLLQAICQQISLALSNARRYQDVDRLVSLLAAEQYRLEGLIEMLPVGVLLLDEKRNLLVTNSLAREFLRDLAPDEATGLSISHLGKFSISQLLEEHSDTLSKEIILDDPIRKIFEIEAQPLSIEIPQWVVTLRDVTQERDIQDRVQMQERLATVGQLAAGIAHDFNNIMAAIVVYADLLLMDSSLSPSSQERLTIIQQQVQRAASLIRQILDFSRRSVMEQNLLDLLPFLKEMEKLLKRTLPETISVELIHQDEEYIVLADPTRLQQVFMNLAVNARDAMPEGGSLRFEVSHLNVLPGETPPAPDISPGKWLHIIVADNGLGIPQKDQSHIFEPFFTTKPIGEGTGLGLAQVYGIIKQHGGSIDMISQVNEGTQFNIYLPSYSENDTEPKKVETSLELDGAGKTVLLVEDDQATRKALEAMLSMHNYYVLIAENGVKALEHLEKHADTILLMICDIVMPQMGGFDLYEMLQSRWPQVQVLFITGHPLDGKNQQILEQGKVRWLQKPFTVQEFNQVLIELLA